MSFLHSLARGLKMINKRRKLQDDLKEELAFHLAMMEEKRCSEGLPPQEAHQASHRAFGNEVRVQEQLWSMWTFNSAETWLQDIRYALRTLRNTPVLAAVVVLSLALGIGANTAIFSLLDAAMLRMLPVGEPQQLTLLTWTAKAWPGKIVSDLEGSSRKVNGQSWSYSFSSNAYEYIRDHNRVFDNTFAFAANNDAANVGLGGKAEEGLVQAVSGNFFNGMRVSPLIGRSIAQSDDTDSAAPVAMVSYSFWKRRMGGDASVVGKSITVNGEPVTVVGVLPPEFYGVEPGQAPQVWITLVQYARQNKRIGEFDVRGSKVWWLAIIGRRKPGVSEQQVKAEVDVLLQQAIRVGNGAELKPEDLLSVGTEPANRGLDSLRRQFSTPLFLLMGMVGVVLLIACANAAGLLLARAAARQREIAVRLSLGASRWRVVRQLMTESLLLAILSGAAALIFARWGTAALIRIIASGRNPIDLTVTLNTNILLFTAGVAILCGLIFGLVPALRATRVNLYPVLKQSGGQFNAPGGRFLSGKVLVAAQLALCMMLLVSAGLLLRTLNRLQNVELGFDHRNLVTFRVQPGLNEYKGNQLIAYYSEFQRRLERLPGVLSVGMSQLGPIGSGESSTDIDIPGYTASGTRAVLHRHVIGGDYFQTLRIPVLLGRTVGKQDTAASPLVTTVNERLVKEYFRGENPIGKTLEFGSAKDPYTVTIVGVVRDVKYNQIREEAPPTIYFSYLQRPQFATFMTFLVRTAGDPSSVMPGIQREALAVDKNIPVLNLRTETEVVSQVLMLERLFALLSSLFSGVALVLACIGLYGTISYTVARRTNEIGIRMALGAARERIIAMVMRETFIVVTVGIAIGMPLAWFATRIWKTRLFGLSPQDPVAMGVALLIIVLVAVVAGFLPARKASRVDPMVSLRYE